MISVADAQARILERVKPLGTATIPLGEAFGRRAAVDLKALINLPVFDNSAMDGYAVRAADVKGASASNPVSLRVAGKTPAGRAFESALQPGQCVRLFTGSPLPSGADAVVMQEDTRVQNDAVICVLDEVKPWENIRFKGEDARQGDRLVQKGIALDGPKLGVLAAVGHAELVVARQPVVALLATGAELISPPALPGPGQIYESNRIMLAALLENIGALPLVKPIVRDDLRATVEALEDAFADADCVVTSGGVSVGEFDHVKAAFEQIGGKVDFWKVAMRPGKPFVFGEKNGRWLFGLPGNPVSAFATFLLLALPALLKMGGALDCSLKKRNGTLGQAVANRGDRPNYMRVIMDTEGKALLAGAQGSHFMSSLANANGLVEVAAGANLEADSPVTVLQWD